MYEILALLYLGETLFILCEMVIDRKMFETAKNLDRLSSTKYEKKEWAYERELYCLNNTRIFVSYGKDCSLKKLVFFKKSKFFELTISLLIFPVVSIMIVFLSILKYLDEKDFSDITVLFKPFKLLYSKYIILKKLKALHKRFLDNNRQRIIASNNIGGQIHENFKKEEV